MTDFRDFMVIAAIIVGCVAVPTVPVIGVAAWLDSSICASRASKMELPGSWGLLQGCMISVDGKWMPLENYQLVKLRPDR